MITIKIKSALISLQFLLVILFLILIFTGCKTSQPQHTAKFLPVVPPSRVMEKVTIENHIDPNWLKPSSDLFTLGPGDKVEIEIIGETNSLTATVVGPDGKVYFNLLPGIDIWGMTITEAKNTIQNELTKYIRGSPQVAVTLRGVESRRVWLMGRLQAPGVYNLAAPTTLLEAISTAGGTLTLSAQSREAGTGSPTEEIADLQRSFVVRNGQMLPINFEKLLLQGDMSQNIYLQADDFVYLPGATAREVYVMGAVGQARPVAYSEGMTVASAIAGAYGTVRDAWLHHVVVVRGALTEPEATILDYYDIVKGKAPDMALKPRDIVYVPYSPYRYVRRYIDVALNAFVNASAVNAGIKLTQGSGASVVIPVGSTTTTVAPPPIPPR